MSKRNTEPKYLKYSYCLDCLKSRENCDCSLKREKEDYMLIDKKTKLILDKIEKEKAGDFADEIILIILIIAAISVPVLLIVT